MIYNYKILAGIVVVTLSASMIKHPFNEELHYHPDPPQYYDIYHKSEFTNPSTSDYFDVRSI